MSELMQTCNMDERTNEEKIFSEYKWDEFEHARAKVNYWGIDCVPLNKAYYNLARERVNGWDALLQRNKELESALTLILNFTSNDNDDFAEYACSTAEQALKGAK